jgi:hypothetical protein
MGETGTDGLRPCGTGGGGTGPMCASGVSGVMGRSSPAMGEAGIESDGTGPVLDARVGVVGSSTVSGDGRGGADSECGGWCGWRWGWAASENSGTGGEGEGVPKLRLRTGDRSESAA